MEISMDELVEDKRQLAWSPAAMSRSASSARSCWPTRSATTAAAQAVGARQSAVQDAEGKVSRAGAMNLHDELRDAFVPYARRQKMRVDR